MKETEKLWNPLLILGGLPEKITVLVQMPETKEDLSVEEIEEHLDRTVLIKCFDQIHSSDCNYSEEYGRQKKRQRGTDPRCDLCVDTVTCKVTAISGTKVLTSQNGEL